jgi:hypothetical protein
MDEDIIAPQLQISEMLVFAELKLTIPRYFIHVYLPNDR